MSPLNELSAADTRSLADRRAELPRVAYCVGGLYSESSGVGRIVCDLANAVGAIGRPITIYTATCPGREVVQGMLHPSTQCVAMPGRWMKRLFYSPGLRRLLADVVCDVEVVHNHSVWMLPNHYASAAARRWKKPVVFTAHGTLEPWALGRSRLKKRLVGRWFQDRDLREAACIHVNSTAEVAGVRAYGLRNPIAIVPNGVDLGFFERQPEAQGTFLARHPELRHRPYCLFLSRLHEKKGLAHLLQAWARVCREFRDWMLVIAGPDNGFEGEVRRAVAELNLVHSVRLTGPLYGDDKLDALRSGSFLVLPSFSEGFPMVLLEALACRLPVLFTPGCNFPEIATAEAGVQVEPDAESTERGLRDLLSMSDCERRQMGGNGRALVESAYTWEQVARQMIEVYCWLAGGGPPPERIQLA
jgi:poly(glycerol-phosphate) alpha-glucosyltransferase